MAILHHLSRAFSELLPAARALTGLWALLLLSFPILERFWGEQARHLGLIAAVVVQVTVVLILLGTAWGWLRAGGIALVVVVLAWTAEFIGSRTGVPFGRYHYTGRLQPQLGRVPLLIPLAWLMMLPPAWAIADLIAAGRGLPFIAISALAFTAWDLFLDPQMVGWGLWVWKNRSGYFGIPWVNFAGWVLIAGAITAIVRPGPLPAEPLSLVYAITWLLETAGLGILSRRPGPALAGFLGMGGMLTWAWLLK